MFATRRRHSPRSWGRRYRPVIEALEDRVVPSLLGLAQLGTNPDITSGVLNNLSYTQQGNNANPFHYDSVPLWITQPDGGVQYITDLSDGSLATTNLNLLLDNTGKLVPGTGNDFSVTGHVTVGAQTYDGTLLTARPQAFGYGDSFSSAAGEFEVQLSITGGQLATGMPNSFRMGDDLGLLIHQPGLPISNFPQTFSFSTLDTGVYDGESQVVVVVFPPPPIPPT
jgi:hypothetical protein